jgi:uncharacterized OB-fold protein
VRPRAILLQQCTTCGAHRCPPLPACPACGATGARWHSVGGDGVVYSWIVVRRPVGTVTAEELPITFATVEIDHGCRLVGRLLDADGARIGAAVSAAFVDHGDWTELAFRSTGGIE